MMTGAFWPASSLASPALQANPTNMLHVAGTFFADSNLYANAIYKWNGSGYTELTPDTTELQDYIIDFTLLNDTNAIPAGVLDLKKSVPVSGTITAVRIIAVDGTTGRSCRSSPYEPMSIGSCSTPRELSSSSPWSG